MQNKPITKHDTSRKALQATEDRLDYIFNTIFEKAGSKLTNWYVCGAAEGNMGNVDDIIQRDYISFSGVEYDCKNTVKNKNFSAILDGEIWHLLEDIPLAWLYEDFETELVETGLQTYANQLKSKKEVNAKRRAANKQKKATLIISARSKLTVDEQKAVGIYERVVS